MKNKESAELLNSQLKSLRKTSSQIGLVLLGFSVFTLILSFFIYYISNAINLNALYLLNSAINFLQTPQGTLIKSMLVITFCEIIVILIFKKLFKIKRREYIKKPKNGVAFTIKGTLWFISLNFILSIVGHYLMVLITKMTGIVLYAPDMSTPPSSDTVLFVLYAINAIILAPIFEEIIFRGLILNTLRRYGNLFAIVASSLLFGIWHGNFSQAIPVGIASIVLGFLAIKTNSIVPTIIIHSLSNTLIIIFSSLSDVYNQNFVDSLEFVVIVVIILLGLAAFIGSFSHLNFEKNETIKLSGFSKTINFIVSPGMFLFLVYVNITILILSKYTV